MISVTSNLPAAQDIDLAAVDRWLESLASDYGEEDRALLHAAFARALQAHGRRATDATNVRETLYVADILAKLRLDPETLAASILHGVLGTAERSVADIEGEFGPNIARMVGDLARIESLINAAPAHLPQEDKDTAENLRRLLLGIADDVRVILVVVAAQLQRMRRAKGLVRDEQSELARKTLAIYAPLANRLGIGQIKWELEDLSLRYLEPENYQRIAQLLAGKRRDREGFIHEVVSLLRAKLQEAGVTAEITGRPKHIYSIWHKMQRKSVPFEQIFDVLAVRVLVDEIADCYTALGIVHSLWEPIRGEFDDYIAVPKLNMYQSLHTAVLGPGESPLEIQIRTRDMHSHAELGVAAHWRYKEKAKHDADFERRILWMRHWLELKDEDGSGAEFLERFKDKVAPRMVYVFSPKGQVIELPKGATPVDFAYAVHSEIGHRCRGARVDGRIVQLSYALQSGERVEILTAKNGAPSRDWLNANLGYLKTTRARNRVRQWFKHLDFDQHVALGRASLEREMTRLGITEKLDLAARAGHYNFCRAEDLLAAIGRGEISVGQVVAPLVERPTPPARKRRSKVARRKDESRGEVRVAGVDDLMTHMARCCKPVPHDPIVGFITKGRGVTVHRANCSNLVNLGEQGLSRLVDVVWSEQDAAVTYPVDILVRSGDRKGLLRDISSILTDDDIDVTGVTSASDRRSETATMQFTIEISDVEQLERVLAKVAELPDVTEVRRRS